MRGIWAMALFASCAVLGACGSRFTAAPDPGTGGTGPSAGSGAGAGVGGKGSGGQPMGAGGASQSGAGGAMGGARPCTKTYPEEVALDTPLSYWRLDETGCEDNCTIRDATDTQSALVYNGSMNEPGFELDVDGVLSDNGAIELFAFSESTIDFGLVNEFKDAPFSLETWVFLTDVNDSGGILGRDDADCSTTSEFNPPGYRLEYLQNGRIRFSIEGCGFEWSVVETPNPVATEAWLHVVATFDGASIRLYVNGVSVDEETSQSAPSWADQAFNFVAGGRAGGAYNHLDARLDEIAVYGYALGPDRVMCHYSLADNL